MYLSMRSPSIFHNAGKSSAWLDAGASTIVSHYAATMSSRSTEDLQLDDNKSASGER